MAEAEEIHKTEADGIKEIVIMIPFRLGHWGEEH